PRKVKWKILEEADYARALFETDTRQLANTNTRVFERRHLRANEEVEAVFVVVLIYEDLRRLFRRDRLLNVVGEDLPEREVGRDVHVSDRDETIFEIVYAVNVKTRPALIRMRIIGGWSKYSIFNGVETDVEIRARVGARTQVGAEAESALRVDVVAKRDVGGATEC